MSKAFDFAKPGFWTSSHPTTDLLGQPVLQRLHFGACRYCVSPSRKALWECAYRFSPKDLEVIYEQSKLYSIGFGKVVYVEHDLGRVVFECWHSIDTWKAVEERIRASQFATRAAEKLARQCCEYWMNDPERVSTKRMVGVAKFDLGGRLPQGYVWEVTYCADTFAEAIEQGIFLAGLQAVGSIKI